MFGRGGEEVIQFRKFGVESKVVPVSFSVCRRRRLSVDRRRSHNVYLDFVDVVVAIFTFFSSSSLLQYFF